MLTNIHPSAAPDQNGIATRQNAAEVLACQSAAKVYYGRAEALFYWQFALGAIIPIVLAFLPDTLVRLGFMATTSGVSLRAWAALYGLTILLLDEMVLDPWQLRLRRLAATAQEMFDTDLFRLPWRTSKVGERIDAAEIHRMATRWRGNDPSLTLVRDWYAPIVSCVPLDVGRVLCQRLNLWWDSTLRRYYRGILLTFAAAVPFLTLAVALWGGISLLTLLIALQTLAPSFRWAIREANRHGATAKTLDRLVAQARTLTEALNAGELTLEAASVQSRELQDDIFDHRRSAPTGLWWVYAKLRRENETGMRLNAEQWVRAYRERWKLPPCREPN